VKHLDQHREGLEAAHQELKALNAQWAGFNDALERQCKVVEAAVQKHNEEPQSGIDSNVYVLNFAGDKTTMQTPLSKENAVPIATGSAEDSGKSMRPDTAVSRRSSMVEKVSTNYSTAKSSMVSSSMAKHAAKSGRADRSQRQALWHAHGARRVNERGNLLRDLAESDCFNWISVTMAGLNAALYGIQAHSELSQAFQQYADPTYEPDQDWQHAFRICTYSFLAWLIIELMINFAAFRIDFFIGARYKWHIFDLLVVIALILEVVMPHIQMSFVKVIRVARLGKIIQAIKFVRFFHSLQKMLISLKSSLITLFWAFFLLFILMYVFGIMMMNGVAAHLTGVVEVGGSSSSEETEQMKNLRKFYGSFWSVIFTLFKAISGGDWPTLMEPLEQVGSFYAALWIPYIGFVLFGLLNIVTGIFVDSTLKTAEADHAIAVIEQVQREERLKVFLTEAFEEADKDGTGRISEMEFDEVIDKQEVLAFLASVGIDRQSSRRLFKTLDQQRHGYLTVNQIVNGCFNLRGEAKAVDMMAMMQHVVKMEGMVQNLFEAKEHQGKLVQQSHRPRRRDH